MVKYIQSLHFADTGAPGIILANLGQLRWWRHGKKAVTQMSWFSLPQKSAVHGPFRFDVVHNTVPENRSTEEHVTYMLRTVTAELCDPKAMFSIIGVSDGVMQVVSYLNKVKNWEVLGPRIEAMAVLAPYYRVDDLKNERFVEWLRKVCLILLASV
jgi:Arb2 domain-containing protein